MLLINRRHPLKCGNFWEKDFRRSLRTGLKNTLGSMSSFCRWGKLVTHFISEIDMSLSSVLQTGGFAATSPSRTSLVIFSCLQRRVAERMARSARRRFPQHLLTDLRKAVESGRAPHASLAWALGVPGEEDSEESSGELALDLLDGLI